MKNELKRIENRNEDCEDTKKKNNTNVIDVLLFFICIVVSASVIYFFVLTASKNSVENYYWFDRMGSERVFYLIMLGLTWYHSLRLLGMVLFSGFTFYYLLTGDLVKYDCNMNSRDTGIKQITDILISNFSYGLFYIIGAILFIINDNVSAIQTNFRIRNSFCDPLVGTITIAIIFFLVLIAYIPFQELISYMRKKKEICVAEIDEAIQKTNYGETKQYYIQKKKKLLMEPIIQTSIGNRLTVFLSIIIPLVGVVLQAIQLFA